MRQNLIINTDSYKLSHFQQYPKNTQNMFEYIEARKHDGSYEIENEEYYDRKPNYTIFFGLQYTLIQYLTKRITAADIVEAKAYFQNHIPFWNEEGWQKILDKHDGFLPIRVRAVPEGTKVPLGNVLVTVECTDKELSETPEMFWLVSYIETLILRGVWYPTTVATLSNLIKQDILSYWKETSDAPRESVDVKLHDFGARGVSSFESSVIGGSAHAANFIGTDNVATIPFIHEYYKSIPTLISIPAAEHSTITAWGEDGEIKAFENMLDTYPEGFVAVVSDSYDLTRAVREYWGKQLKEKVQNRNGTLVVRPDSGDPATIVVSTITDLMDAFGYTTNSKGYKVLPDCVRVIQGDGINRKSINNILKAMKLNKLSVDNIVFGMGGALLQEPNRDTFSFAMKCSAIDHENIWKDVYKKPATDSSKVSKKGRLKLIEENGKFKTVPENQPGVNLLETVFENGKMVKEHNFNQIKNRIESYSII